jgi:mono/diheme cytochrome c family protein
VIAFLRSRPAVANAVPDHRLTLLGKALMAFAIEPAGPTTPPRRTSPIGPSVERGDYLANAVSACAECHTDRDGSGELVGPRFGGGQQMDLADPTKVAVPPNLTPDAGTSPIGRWDEDMFVVRFRAGEIIPGTPMRWGAFAHMTEDDVRSVYRYLRTLPPTRHETGPGMRNR